MLGSLVYVGGMSVEEAHAIEGIDGATVGANSTASAISGLPHSPPRRRTPSSNSMSNRARCWRPRS